jgi:hypothetical protein
MFVPSSMKTSNHYGLEGDGNPVVFDGIAQAVERFAEGEIGYDIKGCIVYRTYDQYKCEVQDGI